MDDDLRAPGPRRARPLPVPRPALAAPRATPRAPGVPRTRRGRVLRLRRNEAASRRQLPATMSHVRTSRSVICYNIAMAETATSLVSPGDSARFWSYVGDPDRLYADDECWPWRGACGPKGYGRTWTLNRSMAAHRVSWMLAGRYSTPEMVLDHLCCSPEWCSGGPSCPHRDCVNPNHLEEVTAGENVLRGNGVAPHNVVKTHCPRRHPLIPGNLRASKVGDRSCKICHRDRERDARLAGKR